MNIVEWSGLYHCLRFCLKCTLVWLFVLIMGFLNGPPLLYLVEFGFASMKLVISGTFLCGQIHILNPCLLGSAGGQVVCYRLPNPVCCVALSA